MRSLGEAEPLCGAAFDGETLAASPRESSPSPSSSPYPASYPIHARCTVLTGWAASSFFTNTAADPCGRTVRVTNAGSGDVVTATVTDACAPLNCLGGEDIALSAAALSALGGSTVLPTRGEDFLCCGFA